MEMDIRTLTVVHSLPLCFFHSLFFSLPLSSTPLPDLAKSFPIREKFLEKRILRENIRKYLKIFESVRIVCQRIMKFFRFTNESERTKNETIFTKKLWKDFEVHCSPIKVQS